MAATLSEAKEKRNWTLVQYIRDRACDKGPDGDVLGRRFLAGWGNNQVFPVISPAFLASLEQPPAAADVKLSLRR